MHGMLSARFGRFASALLVAGLIAGVGAASALASTTESYTVTYGPGGGSAWGKATCTGKITINKAYPGDLATGGGRETEKCVSDEPGGKLTGYFTPGEVYTGYWESDFYGEYKASLGQTRLTVLPTTVTITVAKSFKSFRVKATYAAPE